jgi:hypothetical protein
VHVRAAILPLKEGWAGGIAVGVHQVNENVLMCKDGRACTTRARTAARELAVIGRNV